MSEAWIMLDSFEDQRKENRLTPNVPVSYEELAELGIFYRKLNPETMLEPSITVEEVATVTMKDADGADVEVTTKTSKKISEVDHFMKRMGYKARDEVFCCPAKLENYETRLKSFFEEHIHEDEEIRLIRDGVGYFDIRAKDDKRWIRIKVTAGDLIIVPAGCYHRFTMDENDYTHAIRLFSEVPKWTPLNRAEKETAVNAARVDYEQRFMLPIGHPDRTLVSDHTVWKEGGAANLTNNMLVNMPLEFDNIIRKTVRRISEEKAADACRFFKVDAAAAADDANVAKLSANIAASLEKKNSAISSNHLKITAQEIPYLMVLYFTGAHFPRINESWCPDCVTSDPIVSSQLSYVAQQTATILNKCCDGSSSSCADAEKSTPEKPFAVNAEALKTLLTSSSSVEAAEKVFNDHPFAHVSFLQCNIQRASYMGNPDYHYRTHPFIQLKSIPTVMVLRVGLKGKSIAAAVDQEAEGEAAHIPVDEAETEMDVAVIGRYTDPLPEDWLTSILAKQFGPSA